MLGVSSHSPNCFSFVFLAAPQGKLRVQCNVRVVSVGDVSEVKSDFSWACRNWQYVWSRVVESACGLVAVLELIASICTHLSRVMACECMCTAPRMLGCWRKSKEAWQLEAYRVSKNFTVAVVKLIASNGTPLSRIMACKCMCTAPTTLGCSYREMRSRKQKEAWQLEAYRVSKNFTDVQSPTLTHTPL